MFRVSDQVYAGTHIYANMYAHIYTYIYIYIYTQLHIYIQKNSMKSYIHKTIYMKSNEIPCDIWLCDIHMLVIDVWVCATHYLCSCVCDLCISPSYTFEFVTLITGVCMRWHPWHICMSLLHIREFWQLSEYVTVITCVWYSFPMCISTCDTHCMYVWRGCNTLQHTATHCNTLQHTATHLNTLQHTATHSLYVCMAWLTGWHMYELVIITTRAHIWGPITCNASWPLTRSHITWLGHLSQMAYNIWGLITCNASWPLTWSPTTDGIYPHE